MNYVVYAYKLTDGRLDCVAYTQGPMTGEAIDSQLDHTEAEAAAAKLREEGWSTMVLVGTVLPWPVA